MISPKALLEDVKRDSAIRSGLLVACSALIAVLLLKSIFASLLADRLETRIENALSKRHTTALSNAIEFAPEEQQIIRKFRKSLPVRDEGVYAWLNESGEVFSGSVSGVDCREGYYDGYVDISQSAAEVPIPLVSGEFVNRDIHDRFRFLAQKRDDKCLVFGQSMYEVEALEESISGTFLWLLPLCLLPPLLISFLYSFRTRKRLKKIANVVREVAGGDLSARLEVDGDDDIDRLARSTNRSIDRLQESVDTLQNLSAVVAHDLRGPLNRIANPLDEAIRENESGKIATQSLYKVQEGIDEARSVFDALLRITQIESGQRRLQFKEVELFNISEELFEVFEPVVADSGRTLKFEVIGEGTEKIQGDADLLRQAVVNLVENAIRYTPEGANIRIGLERQADSTALYVSDNGPGVPEAERERVVQRLYRYKDTAKDKQGHGLGLSLVKAIAELHHGELVLGDAQPGLKVSLQI